jgi:prepilin-type N-terminal cleavage/methylation domain-containing protein
MMTRAKNSGFTLVEGLVASAIAAVLALALGLMARDVFSLRSGISASLSTQSEAARVLRPFADDLRAAVASETGAFPIAQSATSSITFYADVDHDGVAERAQYFLQNGEFRRAISEPSGEPAVYGPAATTTLVHGVLASTTLFSYYPQGYDGTASSSALGFPVFPSEVRSVRVWLSVDQDPIHSPGPAEITTTATVRNLRGTALDD